MASMNEGSARHHRAVGAVPDPSAAEAGPPITSESRWSRLRKSVWVPVLAKAGAILCGMLALAAIGASSIARGSGGPAPSALPAASFVAGGFLPHAPRPAQITPDAGIAEPSPPAPSKGLTADGKVILNEADVADLRKLPGVGAKRAQAILDLRQKLGGRFRKVTDLLRVKGIGPRTLAKWKELVVLDAPKS